MAQRDQGMRMLINDEEDEEEDDDDDDDDDDDVDAADDGDDDEDDEDKDGEGEDEDENEDDDRLPAGNLFSGGARGTRGDRTWPARGGGEGSNWKVSGLPMVCLFLAKARATSASTASFRDFV